MTSKKARIALLYRGPQHECRDEFTSFVPVGFFNVLAYLRKRGWDARLHNLSDVPARELRGVIASMPCDAALLSSFYGNHHETFEVARLVKLHHRHAPVVLGGPLAALGAELLRRIQALDFVIAGEGEQPADRLLATLLASQGSLDAIPGLIRRQGDDITAQKPRLATDIDPFFFLPSEVLPHCRDVRPENLAIVISSRGCPYRCSFCSSPMLWQNRIRRHGTENLIRYLADLRQTTGELYFSMRDDNFLVDRQRVRDFCRMLHDAKLHYLWNAQCSAHLVDDTTVAALAAAGCDQIQMGIETVTPRLQALLDKQNDPQVLHHAIATLRRHAVRPFGYFIYGMRETGEEARENTAFITGSGLMDAVASPLALYPGTALSARTATNRFFGKGEIMLFDPASAAQHRPAYGKALGRLARQPAFTVAELKGAGDSAVATIARHFAAAERGDARLAVSMLEKLSRREGANPWPHRLLAGWYDAAGDDAAARRHERLARRMAGTLS